MGLYYSYQVILHLSFVIPNEVPDVYFFSILCDQICQNNYQLDTLLYMFNPRMLCNGNGAISHLQTEMGFLRNSITAYTIDKNTFSAHLEFFMWERKFEKKFFKKSPLQPPNGMLFIFKLPFPNGSHHNGVCRTLWALSIFWSLKSAAAPMTTWLHF